MFKRCFTQCAAYFGLVMLLALMFATGIVDRKPYAPPASLVKSTAPESVENVAGPEAAIANRLQIVSSVRHARVAT